MLLILPMLDKLYLLLLASLVMYLVVEVVEQLQQHYRLLITIAQFHRL